MGGSGLSNSAEVISRGTRRIPSARPFFPQKMIGQILRDIESALNSGVLTDGPHVRDLESEFAKYVKVRHGVAVASGTAALEIVLRYFQVRGLEVLVPTNTFVATPNSVLFAGGKPIFVDIREDTLCVDPEDVRRKISTRTAGIIVVHIAGLICPQIGDLVELCEDHHMFLLEDCAHAHGGTISGRRSGSLGDAGCFSMYATKVMTTGEGGIITTNDGRLAEAACRMRSHGLDSQRRMTMLGHNWRMSEIAAILGKYQLENLESFVCRRNEIAERYESMLAKMDGVSVFRTPRDMRHSYYKYPVRVGDDIDRERVEEILREEYGIETGNVYDPPCHLHPFYQESFGTRAGDLPAAERVLEKVMCLPIYVGMTEEDVRYIAEAVNCSISRSREGN
jgi:perosamine synthetase